MDLKQAGICSTSSGKKGSRDKKTRAQRSRRDMTVKKVKKFLFSKAIGEIFKNLLQVLPYQGLSQWPLMTYLYYMPMPMSK